MHSLLLDFAGTLGGKRKRRGPSQGFVTPTDTGTRDMAGSSHARVRRRRAVFAAPAYLTTVFALELALSAGFGPTAWTTPYTGTMSTRRSSSSSSSVSDWRPRERRAVRHGGVHVAARAGESVYEYNSTTRTD